MALRCAVQLRLYCLTLRELEIWCMRASILVASVFAAAKISPKSAPVANPEGCAVIVGHSAKVSQEAGNP